VVLSIIGVNRVPELEYYVAKEAQEHTHQAHSPGVHILRAAQFLQFPSMAIGWGRNGGTTTVDDLLSQPVAVDEIAKLLLELATGEREETLVELAGPRRGYVAELARRVVEHRNENLTVIARAPNSIKNGGCSRDPTRSSRGPASTSGSALSPPEHDGRPVSVGRLSHRSLMTRPQVTRRVRPHR
jgi:dTDP-4-dehydrorhamnose reductase